jgi:hypothetical protein
MILPLLFGFILFFAAPAHAKEISLIFDHSEWDQFLKKFVNEKGEVDYRSAKKEPELLNAYVEKLKSFSTREFKAWPREEKMAVYINAFNAGVIKLVLKHYPLKTILDISGVWDEGVIQIGVSPRKKMERESPKVAETHSLNLLENTFLRSRFRDEKVLFALSRGARGSPRLRQEAYVGPRLEGQLYLVTREFVNNGIKNRIEPGEKKIVLSRLFKWYAADFLLNWGDLPEPDRWKPEELAVLSFLAHYLEDPKKVGYLRDANYKVKYEVFDWSLNDWDRSKESGKT